MNISFLFFFFDAKRNYVLQLCHCTEFPKNENRQKEKIPLYEKKHLNENFSQRFSNGIEFYYHFRSYQMQTSKLTTKYYHNFIA